MTVPSDRLAIGELVRAASYSLAAAHIALDGGADAAAALNDIALELGKALAALGLATRESPFERLN